MSHSTSGDCAQPSVGSVLWHLLTRPQETLISLWNWKAALLSVATRAPVLMLTTLSHGWRRASLAMLVEAAFRAGTTGFFAAATQAFAHAQPAWMALLIMLTGFPLLALALDGLLHLAMHTPNLAAGMMASLILSALASAFNWYIMRRGALLMGGRASSFLADLKAMPLLAVRFTVSPTVWAWRSTRQLLARSEAE